MKKGLVFLAALAGQALAVSAVHAWPDESARERTNRVGVIPFVLAEQFGIEEVLFSSARPVEELSLELWQTLLQDRLASLDLVSLVPVEAVSGTLMAAADPKGVARAESLFASGLEHWKNLDAGRAMTDLDAARNLLERDFGAIASSGRLGDIEFHRGLALLDLGDESSALEAFERMFVFNPSRRFERGYYGTEVERVLLKASKKIASIEFLRYRFPAERLATLAKRMRLDAIAIGIAHPVRDGTSQLEVALFDARNAEFTSRSRLDLSSREAAEDQLDRLLTSWLTCLIESPRGLARPSPRKRVSLDLSYTHGVWLKHRRTRDFLQGPGAQIGLNYAVEPGLELWARMSQRTTLSDSNGDLLDVFATTHLAAGIGLAVGSDTWRFLLRAGLDTALSLSDIAMSTDVDCKFFGPESPRCGSIFVAASPALWLGLDFSLGLRFSPTRSWYGTLKAGVTGYVISPSVVDELNFPLYGALGFGLPF